MTTVTVHSTRPQITAVNAGATITAQTPSVSITQVAQQGPTGPVGPAGAAQTDGLVIDVTAAPYNAAGDGVTNDRTAVHAARDAGGVGATIFFPPGTYAGEFEMTVNNQRWIVAKGATLLSLASGTGDGVLISGDNCILEGPGTIDGNKANRTSTKACIVIGYPDRASGTVIRDLTIQNADENGVKIYGDAGTGNEDVTIENCTFTGIEREAIYANYRHHRLRILNNRITSTSASYNGMSVLNDTDDVQIRGNIVKGPSRMGIEVWNDGGTYDPGNLRAQVTGNIISGATWHGISVAGKSHYATVTDNTITDTDLAAIEIAEANNSTVTGNTIHDCTGGMSIDTTTGSTFTGNTIVNCGGKPVHILDSTDVEFTGNSVDGWTNVAGAAAVYIQNSSGVVIDGNTTRNGPSGVSSLTVDNTSKVRITGNRLGTGIYLYQNGAGAVADVGIVGNELLAATYKVYRQGTLSNIRLEGNSHQYASAAPSGTGEHWGAGDKVWNTAPAAGGAPGWVCVTAGDVGTFKAMANLAA